MSDQPGRVPAGRVKLPLLGASESAATAGKASAAPALPSIAPEQRPRAQRAWLAAIGAPGDEAPARFACALSSALAACERYALLGHDAPAALVAALERSGASPLRAAQSLDATQALEAIVAELPRRALVLVVENVFACRLRGVLDVWVGPAPAHGGDPQLVALQRAADLIVPAHAEAVASALGRELAPRFAAR